MNNIFKIIGLNMTEKISSFLKMQDRINLALTCKLLNNYFWKTITTLDVSNKFSFLDGVDKLEKMAEIISKNAQNLKYLDLSNLLFNVESIFNRLPPSIVHLNLQGCDIKDIGGFERYGGKLLSLNLSFTRILSKELISILPSSLKILILSGCSLSTPTLETLSLKRFDLKVLDVSNCKFVDKKFLYELPESLEALNLSGCNLLNDPSVIDEWRQNHYKNISIFLPPTCYISKVYTQESLFEIYEYKAPTFCIQCKKRFIKKFFCHCCLSCGSSVDYIKVIKEDDNPFKLSPPSEQNAALFSEGKRYYKHRPRKVTKVLNNKKRKHF